MIFIKSYIAAFLITLAYTVEAVIPVVTPMDVTVTPIDITISPINIIFETVDATSRPTVLSLLNTTGQNVTPTYRWNAITGATNYQIWVMDSSGNVVKTGYSNIEANCASGTGICSVSPATALSFGTGNWQVQSSNSNAHSSWSETQTFDIIESFTFPISIILDLLLD